MGRRVAETERRRRFEERLAGWLPDASRRRRVLAALSAPRRTAFRVNPLRARDPAEVIARLEAAGLRAEPVPWCPGGWLLVGGSLRALQATAPHAEGAIYVQGLSSQLVPLVLDARPGERVLDMAAAPGSKASQIAAAMAGEGELVANDRSRRRVFRLRSVLEVLGAEAVTVSCRPGESFGRADPGGFDRVLVDAPCSMEGRLRLDVEGALDGWSPARIRRLAGQQGRLLSSALKAVRAGGVVVYATCTLAPEENEGVLDRVLARAPVPCEVLPVEPRAPGMEPALEAWRNRTFAAPVGRARRLLPDERLEGFFVAQLRRTG